jgi:hypothetical protein
MLRPHRAKRMRRARKRVEIEEKDNGRGAAPLSANRIGGLKIRNAAISQEDYSLCAANRHENASGDLRHRSGFAGELVLEPVIYQSVLIPKSDADRGERAEEAAVFVFPRINATIDGAEEEIGAIAERHFRIGIAQRDARKAAKIWNRNRMRAVDSHGIGILLARPDAAVGLMFEIANDFVTVRVTSRRLPAAEVVGFHCRLVMAACGLAPKKKSRIRAPVQRQFGAARIPGNRHRRAPCQRRSNSVEAAHDIRRCGIVVKMDRRI